MLAVHVAAMVAVLHKGSEGGGMPCTYLVVMLMAANSQQSSLLLLLPCHLQGGKPGSSSFKNQRDAQRKGDAGNR
jgi:hypothetical protein